MVRLKFLLFNIVLLRMIIATPQFNLHYIHGQSCLRVNAFYKTYNVYEVVSYCMSEIPTNFLINDDKSFSKFTFFELSKQNVTSQDLYIWSASIDLIEDYQFYLNQQQSTTPDLFLAKTQFYNCTLPRFGPFCQYELVSYHSNYSSLKEIIHDFYQNYNYSALQTLTCYTHLKCNHNPLPRCLQWFEICDGKIDCFDDGLDEVDCWQIEINECQDHEYRCYNGQCIPKIFHENRYGSVPDCTDASDEVSGGLWIRLFCQEHSEPSFECEDVLKLGEYSYNLGYYMQRYEILRMRPLYFSQYSTYSQECLSTLQRLITLTDSEYYSDQYSQHIQIIQNECPDIFFFPSMPIIFTDIYLGYMKNDFQTDRRFSETPFYICFNQSRYDFVNPTDIMFNGTACFDAKTVLEFDFNYRSIVDLYINSMQILYNRYNRYHHIFNYTTKICNRSSMYQCFNSSKCISISRLMNMKYDCPYMDDENFTHINSENIIKQLNKTHFKCSKIGKYIHPSLIENQHCDCLSCEDEYLSISYLNTHIVFQHICDGFVDKLPELINNQNQTDETECEQWKCNNTYTRCNNVWNCPNGADEAGCNSYSTLNCSSKEHYCVQPNTYKFICLPIEKANDGNINCLGATDEPKFCGLKWQKEYPNAQINSDFYCKRCNIDQCISLDRLCNNYSSCSQGEDELFCSNLTIKNRCSSFIPGPFPPFSRTANDPSTCVDHGCALSLFEDRTHRTDVEKFLFGHKAHERSWKIIYFINDGFVQPYINEPMPSSSSSVIERLVKYVPHCNRGLNLRIGSNNLTCLCPPTYYGSQCQYQNQRITLTIQFQTLASSWQTLFAIFVALIDNSIERIVHSYEQFTFLSARDCQTRFNIYLLYSTRPKDPEKNYSIHIDVYEKSSFEYRGSLIYPLQFPFLPSYRLSILINIPRIYDHTQTCLIDRCDHGKCLTKDGLENTVIFSIIPIVHLVH